jgi:predicted RNA-binding protein
MDVDPYKNYWSVAERNAVTVELIREVRRLTKTARQ